MAGSEHTVLIVDDERDILEAFLPWLEDRFETRLAHDGEEAIAALGDDLDAVVLDRRMPEMSGDEVLTEIRNRGYDCVVVMLTVVDPDLDILKMDFDDYLIKPVSPMSLLETLEYHLDEIDDGRLDEYLTILSKIDLLESEHEMHELADSEEYTQLKIEQGRLKDELEQSIDDLDTIASTYLDIERH